MNAPRVINPNIIERNRNRNKVYFWKECRVVLLDDVIMGVLLKALGAGVLIFGIKSIRDDAKEENKRKKFICHFDGEISKESFYVMVKRSGRGIRRITNLYAKEAIVYGTVRSQSGISEWCFMIDFNDYGKLTGKYWISSDNGDSDIPNLVAGKIVNQIRNYPDCIDSSFREELRNMEMQ